MSKIGSNTSPPPPSEERTRNDYKDGKKSDDKGQILYGFKAWVKGVFFAVHLLAFNRSQAQVYVFQSCGSSLKLSIDLLISLQWVKVRC